MIKKLKKAFTLVELVIVLAVIGILAAAFVSQVSNLRGQAQIVGAQAFYAAVTSTVADLLAHNSTEDTISASVISTAIVNSGACSASGSGNGTNIATISMTNHVITCDTGVGKAYSVALGLRDSTGVFAAGGDVNAVQLQAIS